MERKEYYEMLSKGLMPPVLLFEGEEAYLKQKALESLRKKLLPEGFEDLNEILLEAPTADELIAAAETVPFMADKRLVIIRDDPALTGRSEADAKLLEYIPKIPVFTVVLFYCSGKPDGRKALYNAIKKQGGVVTFSRLKDYELTSFVVKAFADHGKNCDERTADYLIFTCGSDTANLLNEIGKIASGCSEENRVGPDDVKALVTPSLESKVFAMIDAVVAGQEVQAFELLRTQLLSGAERIGLLAMLLRQYRLLQHVKIMQYEKKSTTEIRTALGVAPFVAEQYIRQAKSCTAGQVKRAVKICLDMEYDVKSGAVNQEGALEAVMLKLLQLKKRG